MSNRSPPPVATVVAVMAEPNFELFKAGEPCESEEQNAVLVEPTSKGMRTNSYDLKSVDKRYGLMWEWPASQGITAQGPEDAMVMLQQRCVGRAADGARFLYQGYTSANRLANVEVPIRISVLGFG